MGKLVADDANIPKRSISGAAKLRFILSVVVGVGIVRLIFALLDDQGPLTGSPVARGTIIGGLIAAMICPAVIWLCYVPTFRRKRQVMLLRPDAMVVAAGIPDENLDDVFESLEAKRNVRGKFGLPFTVTFDAEVISFWRGSGRSLEEFLSIPAQEVVKVEALEGADWTGRWSRLCAITLQRSGQRHQLRFAPYAEAWAVVRQEPSARLKQIVTEIREAIALGG